MPCTFRILRFPRIFGMMRDMLPQYRAFTAAGDRAGRAVVTGVWGSAPRPPGASMLATAGGQVAGSVSGGCVEAAVADEIRAAIARGTPKVVSFGVTDELAWTVGLACGGTITVLVEPAVRPQIVEAAGGEAGAAVVTVLDGSHAGASLVLHEGDQAPETSPALLGLPARVLADAGAALEREASGTAEYPAAGGGTVSVFIEVFPRRPTLVVVGAVHIAAELVPLARRLGFRCVVADGRESLLVPDRFPDADQLVLAWPEEAFARIGLGPATYVCILSHDPKFDDPACRLALRSPARYVGAIGSKKTQAARRARLRAEGFSEEEVARLRGPIGLELGGRAPAEIALAILAEMVGMRYGGKAAGR